MDYFQSLYWICCKFASVVSVPVFLASRHRGSQPWTEIKPTSLSTTNWHLPWVLAIYLYKDYIMLLQLLTSNTLEKVQGGEQTWGPLCSGKSGWTGLQIVRYSQELILWAQFLHLLISRKPLKSFMVTLFLVTSEDFTRLAEAFWKKCFMAWISPSPKITYILSFSPASLEQFLRAIWGTGSRAAVSILPQIKLNFQLSHSAFFSFRSTSSYLERYEILHGHDCFSWLAESFWKNMCSIACIPPSPKSHIHWPFTLLLWSTFSELSEMLSPGLQFSFCRK